MSVAFCANPPYLHLFLLPSAVNVLCAQSACVSVLISHTVLSELYHEKLLTEDEVKRTKGEEGDLLDQLISIQCTKPSEVVTRTAAILAKFGHNEEIRQLRGW